jgi:penicillin-binding protein 2
MLLFPIASAGICVLALWNLQVVRGEEYYQESRGNIASYDTIPGSRGEIYDRYGRLLVGNRVSYNLQLNRQKLVESGDPNGYIERLIAYCSELGTEYIDTCPITAEAPFEYLPELTGTQESRLSKYLEHFKTQAKLDPEISGADFYVWLRSHYSIPDEYTDDQARPIVGVRYELELRTLFNYAPYYFAEDVSTGLIAPMAEQNFPGISIVPVSVREYHTSYAAHLLGRVGPMDSEEYEYYKEFSYPMNALVGKDGIEKAFELDLHGKDGTQLTTRNEQGTITDILYSEEPQPGGNIRLTLDIELQQIAEQELESKIRAINEARKEEFEEKGEPYQEATGGAAVVIDVRNGEILASASYPTYNLATMSRDYEEILKQSNNPLYNRALQGAYEPGSTFKTVTALAALNERIIGENDKITDEGRFTLYDDYQPACWIFNSAHVTHGTINVVEAIEQSCNYFFYDVGSRLGINNISKYAAMMGLGEKTGIQLSSTESAGQVASAELKESLRNERWMGGDTLQAAIGQSLNLFTPIQMASYTATLANSGTRYRATLLKEVKSRDNTQILKTFEPEVLSAADIEPYNFELIRQGMIRVARNGTARSTFGVSYPIKVAAKTGTVQFGSNLETNAVFIAYAPADNPEIAIAVVIEKGGAGSEVASVAKGLFDYYFALSDDIGAIESEGILLR